MDFMKSWVAGYNDNDGEAMASYYDRSEETDCLVSAGLSIKGFEAIKNMYVQDMQALRFYDSKAEEMKQRLLGDVAVVSFIHKFKYVILDGEVHFRIHIRTTATLRKDKDSWKIVSEHSSPIHGIERVKEIVGNEGGE